VKRILLVLTVALVMAAMVVATAMPAFASNGPQDSKGQCAASSHGQCARAG
jgi:hypothetical protein